MGSNLKQKFYMRLESYNCSTSRHCNCHAIDSVNKNGRIMSEITKLKRIRGAWSTLEWEWEFVLERLSSRTQSQIDLPAYVDSCKLSIHQHATYSWENPINENFNEKTISQGALETELKCASVCRVWSQTSNHSEIKFKFLQLENTTHFPSLKKNQLPKALELTWKSPNSVNE